MILSAKSIVIGGGSFVPSLLLFSNNIKNVFCTYNSPCKFLVKILPHLNIHALNFKKYFIEQLKLEDSKWKCTEQQLLNMIHWPIYRQRSTLKFF